MTAPSHAQEPLPTFDQVRSQYFTSKDLTRVSYLYRRCAALQLNAAALLVRKKQNKAASDYENLAQHYMLMSEVVDREIDLYQKTKTYKASETVNLAARLLACGDHVHRRVGALDCRDPALGAAPRAVGRLPAPDRNGAPSQSSLSDV